MISESAVKYGGFKKAARIAENILFIGTIIALLFAVAFSLLANTPSERSDVTFLGYKPLHILSGSMEPYIRTDSIILCKKADFSAIKVGDVISYFNGSELITHRVVALNSDGSLTAKGDANSQADEFKITAGDVKFSLVATMNWTAPVLDTLHSPVGIALIALLLLNVIQFSAIMVLMRRQSARLAERDKMSMAKIKKEEHSAAPGKARHTRGSAIAATVIAVVMCLILLLTVYTELVIITPPDQFYLFGLRPVAVPTDVLAPDIPQNSVLLMREPQNTQLSPGNYVAYQLSSLDGTTDDVGQIVSISASTITVSTTNGTIPISSSDVSGYAVANLASLRAAVNILGNMPPILQALIVLVVAVLLLLLGWFLIRKILARGARAPAGTPADPLAPQSYAPHAPSYDLLAQLDLAKEEIDNEKVERYLKQLDELGPDKIDDFFSK